MLPADWFRARAIRRVEADMTLLTIPDVRQRADYDCGNAVVAAIAAFFGLASPPHRFANAVQGSDPATVEAAIRRVGLRVLSGTMTVADLAHFTRSGRPVVCPVAALGGHWVIVRGVGRGRVHVHCPVAGPVSTRSAEWVANWRDTARDGQEFHRWGIVATGS